MDSMNAYIQTITDAIWSKQKKIYSQSRIFKNTDMLNAELGLLVCAKKIMQNVILANEEDFEDMNMYSHSDLIGINNLVNRLTGLFNKPTFYLDKTNDTSQTCEVPCVPYEVVFDIDGNVYHTVEIDGLVWSTSNLNTTRLNDGTEIPNITDYTEWGNLTTLAYSDYLNDPDNSVIYGKLYNWYAVNSGLLAPEGWHVATEAEWASLVAYLIANGFNYDGTTTGNKIGKSVASSTLWDESLTTGNVGNNQTTNNSTTLNIKPAGRRSVSGGIDDGFIELGVGGYIWTSSSVSSDVAERYAVTYNTQNLYDTSEYKKGGASVRIVKDY